MQRYLLALIVLCLIPATSFAQNMQSRERIDNERREAFEELHAIQEELDQGFFYDYGGWLRSSIYNFEDSANRDRGLRDFDLRTYTDLRYGKVHRWYIRRKIQSTDYNAGDASDGDDHDVTGPVLDQGWWKIDLDELFSLWSDNIDKYESDLVIGRQFLRLGDGFTYNMVNDGVYLDLRHAKYKVELSASKSIRSTADFDQTLPKKQDSKRSYYAAQFTWLNFDKHRPFVYTLLQRDRNNGLDRFAGQGFGYNSEHYGIGSDGELIRKLHYHIEYVIEEGRSHATGSLDSENISAWGFEAKLDYSFPDVWLRPRINTGFYAGSGDKDRRTVTGTINGNQAGTSDNSFLEFGFVDTGFVLAPRLANMEVWNFGWAFRPLEKNHNIWLRNFEIGNQVYFYRKRIANSVFSDTSSTVRDTDVGWAIDSYINWRIFSDLSLSIQYGRFSPGDAYINRSTRHFFTTALTISF